MDVDFTVLSYYQSRLNLCKCFCLFKNNLKTTDEIKQKVCKLLKVWRFSTYKLMHKKVFEHNPVRVQYLRNCPPSIGKLNIDQTFRVCKFYSCPWCWSRRYGGKTLNILKQHLQNNKDTKLYYFIKETNFSKNDYKKSPDLFKKQSTELIGVCRKLTRRNSVLGGMSFTFLEPNDTGFKIVTRLIVSSKKNLTLPEYVLKYKSVDCLRVAYRFGNYPYNFVRPTLSLKGLSFFLRNKNKAVKSSIFFGNFMNRRR